MKSKLFLIAVLTIFLFPVSVFAASFSIRLGQPKSPTNQNSFKITFVALDTRNDRQITVKCFKKGPSDSDFVQFDVSKTLIAGGNTDSCDVTSTILNSNGSYSFKVTGEVPSETALSSSTVTVDYNTSGPETPNSYSKERLNSCDYKIKFKTANDGKTVKVQLFRSNTLNISVGSSSVIASQNIGPNTEGEFINTIPTCGQDNYYVLRAVDSSDNASGTVGDSFTTTTTITTITTGSSGTGIAGSSDSSGAIALGGATSQVALESTTGTSDGASDSGAVTEVSDTTTPTPTVLGSSTDTNSGVKKWLILLGSAFLIYFVLKSFLKGKSK